MRTAFRHFFVLKKNSKRAAFTLIELLVVIAIIGLLSTVAVVALSGARKNARNSKRVADIRQLMTAFSLGLDASATGQYPSSGGDVWVCVSAACTGGWGGFIANGTVDAFFTPYISIKPTDPSDGNSRTAGGYIYNGVAGSSGWPSGHLLAYLLEPPATCGPGTVILTASNYIECYINFDKL